MPVRVVTFLLLGTIAALLWPAVQWWRRQPPPLPPSTQLSFAAPSADAELGAGDEPIDAAISPDEREIVFVATSGNIPRLWRRRLDEDRAVALAGTEGAQQPAWKPTGNVVSFFADGKLKQIALPDGSVSDLADATMALGAAWMADGSLIFGSSPEGPLQRLQDGKLAAATRLRDGDRGHAFPAVFDSSLVYVAVRADGRRIVRLVSGSEEHELTTTTGHAQLAGGVLVHVRDGTLLAQRIDGETGTLAGRGVALGLNAGTSASGRSLMAVSPRLLLFAPSTTRPRELVWFDADLKRTATSGDPGDYRQVRLSPDDRQIATTMLDPLLRTLDIFIVPAEGGGAERLTLALAADTDPVWSPDGLRVLFRSFLDGQPNLFSRRVGVRGAPEETMLRSEGDEVPSDWVRLGGGEQVVYSAASRGPSDVLRLDPAKGSRDPVFSSIFNETDARLSPDGRWISYVSDESGQPDIYASRWPLDGARVRVSFGGGSRPRWSRDGRSLFFLRGSQIMRAERSSEGDARFSAARQALAVSDVRDFDAAHRSDRLLVLLPVEASTRADVRAIVDWRAMFEQAEVAETVSQRQQR